MRTTPRLRVREAIGTERCRCGTPLDPGSPSFELADVPDVVASLVLGRAFCSVSCLRAFLLETLETFESGWIDSVVRDAPAVATALRLVYFYAAAEQEPVGVTPAPVRR